MKSAIILTATAVVLGLALSFNACGTKNIVSPGTGAGAGTGTGASTGTGLASKYIGDAGIENDSDVVFVENFEEAAVSGLTGRYDDFKGAAFMSFSTDVPAGGSGNQSLLWTHIGGQGAASDLYTRLLPGYEQLYCRYYVKFAADCAPIHHWIWLGGLNPPSRWPNPQAGVRPVGDDRLSSGPEPFGAAWRWDFYTYWMEMRGNPGGPEYWGNDFINDAGFYAAKDEWLCVEFMIKMNDPVTESNGEQAFWINGREYFKDGQKVSHLGKGFPKGSWTWDSWIPNPAGQPFDGFRWRTTANLNINYLWLELYITDAAQGRESRVWLDHVVVAKKYIGPMRTE
jgi:hypothetical protein